MKTVFAIPSTVLTDSHDSERNMGFFVEFEQDI